MADTDDWEAIAIETREHNDRLRAACTKCQENPADGDFLWCSICRSTEKSQLRAAGLAIGRAQRDAYIIRKELADESAPLVAALREMVHAAVDEQIGTTYGQAGNPGQLIVTRYEDYSQARWTGELDGDRAAVIASLQRFLGGGA